MQTLLVANSKGGSGKTTLATNLAGWLAGKRQRVGILDLDPQRSASQWLERRPALFPPIAGFPADTGRKEIRELGIEWLVVDSPAGLRGDLLRDAVKRAAALIVPVPPSAFDMAATRGFFEVIAERKPVQEGTLAIATVAMRVDARTHAATELDEFLTALGVPLIAHLRDTQVYVHCARDGASVFDLPRSRGEQDQEQWRPLTRWIGRLAPVRRG